MLRATIAMLSVALALVLTGCNAKPAQWSELGSTGERQPRPRSKPKEQKESLIQIVPQSNQEVADLSPDDVVTIMRRIGFTDEHILELGTDLHDALLNSGGARVVYQGEPEAILAVNGAQIYVQSRSRGSFVHKLGGSPFDNAVPGR